MSGTEAFGNSIQFAYVPGNSTFDGSSADAQLGTTTINVPEPGTLSLLGTGLVGLAGLIRRKLEA